MKKNKLLVFLLTILPWLSFPLLDKKVVKRFLPGSIFMSLYLLLEGGIAEKRKWWWFPFKVRPNIVGELPLIIGPFFIGSLWILKHTFGKLHLYLIVNIIVDTFFSFVMTDWFRKIGYATLVRLSKFQLSLIFLIKSILLYGFQVLYEKTFYLSHLRGTNEVKE